jgi:hypothetical protein
MPAVAPTDNHHPTDHTSRGSTRWNVATTIASIRSELAWRPRQNAVADNTAMPDARITDGSNRVSSANHPMSTTVASHRARGRSRVSAGAATTRTKATFCPETAVKWARPDARKSSTSSRG